MHSANQVSRSIDQQINTLEAQLSRLYAERRKVAVPWDTAASASSCDFPPAANFSNWSGDDVRMPQPWCEADAHHPPTSSLEKLAREGHSGPVTVLPSLLVPCCAHSGTTFLWRCMSYAYHPQRVCGRVDAAALSRRGARRRADLELARRHEDWTSTACPGKRYLLPGLAGNIEGHWDYRKEWFFYGGGAASWIKGWQDYAGVSLPLCYWESEFLRRLREQPLDDTLAQSRRLCTSRGSSATAESVIPVTANSNGAAGGSSHDSTICMHRACIPLDLHKVRISPAYADQYDRKKPRWQVQATKALPRVNPRVHPGAVASDMTPNYLCSPKALRNLVGSIGTPEHFRLLILLRPPNKMLSASYKMFVQWGWVRSASLNDDVRAQLHALDKCNSTLYRQPSLLRKLPADEILAYFGKCWRGTWRDHVTNILPYVCLSAWVAAGFQPHQFRVVRQEKMRSLRAPQLLTALSNFTGLTYNQEVLHHMDIELQAHCEAPDTGANRSPSGGVGRGARRRAREAEGHPLVNSRSTYTEHNVINRTQLQPDVQADLDRLAAAHEAVLSDLHIQDLHIAEL